MNTALTVIRPSGRWPRLSLGEIWEYRELLGFLVWRNVSVRYKQTVLGVLWAVLQPLLPVVVFSLFFGRLARMPSDGVPYPLFAYVALLPWQFFAGSLTEATQSLVADEKLITKVYFPRLIIPISSVLAGLVDLAVAVVLLAGMMAWFAVMPTAAVVLAPLFVAMTVAVALGIGFWLSALNVQYRDVRYALPFVTQFWLFASPVVYPASLVPEAWRWLYGLNPMAGVIEGFRWSLLGTNASPSLIVVSATVAAILLVTGLYYFRRVERTFADVV